MKLEFADATQADAAEIAALRTAAADRLTRDFGKGHWSSGSTERGVLYDLRQSRILVARSGSERRIVATLRLATKKPWAIDVAYFTKVPKALYLVGMAVEPQFQRRGAGRQILAHAEVVAKDWPSNAIRLDAYNAAAGAGPFYARCGYREVARVSYKGNPLIYFERLL